MPQNAGARTDGAGRDRGGRRAAPLRRPRAATDDSPAARIALIATSIVFLALFLFAPLAVVFSEALSKGFATFAASFADPDAQAAIWLTLLIAAIAVPANLVFGLTASWAIAKFSFPGKSLLITLIDLPFSVSPVVSGLVYVLVLGAQACSGRGSRRTICKSPSPCRASCWQRFSSPSPSSRAN